MWVLVSVGSASNLKHTRLTRWCQEELGRLCHSLLRRQQGGILYPRLETLLEPLPHGWFAALTTALRCMVFGSCAVKTQLLVLQNPSAVCWPCDFIAFPRSVCHAITIGICLPWWIFLLRVKSFGTRKM